MNLPRERAVEFRRPRSEVRKPNDQRPLAIGYWVQITTSACNCSFDTNRVVVTPTSTHPMNRIMTSVLPLAALAAALAGCITHKSVVYQDVDRVPVEFESDAAARLFYETLSRKGQSQGRSESTTTISIPIIFENEQKTVSGPNVKFNEAVAICDSNKDGKITEMEARVYANQN